MPKIDLMCQLFNCSRSTLLEKQNKNDDYGDLYAELLTLASDMSREDIIAELARMRWIIEFEKKGKK